MVVRLARAKAAPVARAAALTPGSWALTKSQYCVDGAAGDAILGKPGTRAATATSNCGFAPADRVVHHRSGGRRAARAEHEFVDTTRVTFRTLDEATIARYVGCEMPLDCAGGFKSEGLGIALCESIDSADPTRSDRIAPDPPECGVARGGVRIAITVFEPVSSSR